MAVTLAGQPFQFIQTSAAAGQSGFFFKSTVDGYYFNANTLVKVTDVDYPAVTTPGVVYLDLTYYVMDANGGIHGSELDDPTVWSALNLIQCAMEPDVGVAIARQMNYVVGFGEFTTEFFYDAGNPTGSPLARVDSAFLEIGCAAAGSIAQTDNTLYFMGVTKQKGRSIYTFVGTTPKIVSTPYVDRILNADTLAAVFSYCVRTNGHIFYVLILENVNRTLVYDTTTQEWHEWSSLTANVEQTINTLTASNGVAAANLPSHGYIDGDVITISGATPSVYNGSFNLLAIDGDNFSYVVPAETTSPATGTILVHNYTVSYFKNIYYTDIGGLDVVQGESDGNVYSFSTNAYTDYTAPIDVRIRTAKIDSGNNKKKVHSDLNVIGDRSASYVYVRYTDDDYQTYSGFRPINMSLARSRISRLGTGRRRAYELRHSDNTALRLEALDINIKEGVA